MSIHQIKIRTTRTGHIYRYGQSETARYWWLAFHGYGQLAENLTRKFEVLSQDVHHVIAPEGMSRFYWKGVTGQVVASWMTSRDRYDEIADYVTFIDRVNKNTGWGKKGKHIRILFGFSQGCASLWRWILNAKPDFEILILWAGWLPEDMNYEKHHAYLNQKKIHFIYGLEDEYLTPVRLKILKERFQKADINLEYHTYHGSHRISREILSGLIENILAK